jgi:uncharacterized protein YdhG (YjbR/CyaY superfamily)
LPESAVANSKVNSAADPAAGIAAVEAYMTRVPEPARAALNQLRAMIRVAAPKEATEAISYGIPALRYKGGLVAYAAFKKHCSFFPMGFGAVERFAAELEGYKVSKGTIQFPLDKPLPAALIRKLVMACVERNERKTPA